MRAYRLNGVMIAVVMSIGCGGDTDALGVDESDASTEPADAIETTSMDSTAVDTDNAAAIDTAEPPQDIPEPNDTIDTIEDAELPPECLPGSMSIEVDEKPTEGACIFTLPDPAVVTKAWPFQLFVTEAGVTEALPRYEAAEDCFGSGWYLVSNHTPTAIALCPWSCGKLNIATLQLTWSCTPKPAYAPDPVDGTDEIGADDGTDSSDGTEGTDGTPLCDNEGSIYGLVCAPDKQTYNSDVDVSVTATDCTGEIKQISAKSDALGFYLLENVPAGLVSVDMNGPGIDASYPVWVVAGQVTDATPLAKKECFTNVAPDECYNGATEYKLKQQGASKVVDIIIAVDTSGSMAQEAAAVQNNLNSFATFISNAAIDYHVILIADDSLCVAAPLGGPNCTDGLDFKHVKMTVSSTDALEKITTSYNQYQDFLRPLAQTHFIAVTDDDSSDSAQWFLEQTDVLTAPGYSKPFVFHSVVGTGPEPNVGCSTAADEGTVYLELSQQTGGAVFPICSSEWATVYEQIAEVVVESTCGFPIPNWTAFSNAETIYVKQLIDDVDQELDLPYVPNADACNGPGFYAVPEPPLLVLCPDSCETLTTGKLNLQWVCPADDTVNQ